MTLREELHQRILEAYEASDKSNEEEALIKYLEALFKAQDHILLRAPADAVLKALDDKTVRSLNQMLQTVLRLRASSPPDPNRVRIVPPK